MTLTKSIIRLITLIALGTLGVILIFSQEEDAGSLSFLLHVLCDKAAGALLIWSTARLAARWRHDPFFKMLFS